MLALLALALVLLLSFCNRASKFEMLESARDLGGISGTAAERQAEGS